jgi:hypothetical protein
MLCLLIYSLACVQTCKSRYKNARNSAYNLRAAQPRVALATCDCAKQLQMR